MNIFPSFISKYELGERRLDLYETYLIPKALDIDTLKFFEKLIKKWDSINRINTSDI